MIFLKWQSRHNKCSFRKGTVMGDEDIVKLFFNRDEEAIVALEARYGNYLKSIADNILHSAEDTEECVSDAYLKAWDTIPPENPQNLRGYIGTIVKNRALDRLRKHQSGKRGGKSEDVLLSELEDCIASGCNVDESVDRMFLSEILNKWLEKEKPENRKLFLGRYWYGYSVKELADSQDISQGKVMSKLQRMRKRLRKCLKQEGIFV